MAAASGALPDGAEIAIVGAGVVGLSIAYNLARRGQKDIVIIERGYLAEGASGRNGGGIRQQWSTESNISLMQRSVELCRQFAHDMGVNIWFRPGGYLFLARTDAEVARLEKNASLQKRLGLSTRMLTPREAGGIVTEMATAGILAASYNGEDGILFPWPFLWGYANRATELGASLFTHTAVTGIDVEGDGYRLHTARGSMRAERIINACGAWSPELAAMVGIELPTRPIRHEICSSEPLKPFLGPMVSELSSGLYFSQSMRGEIVGGVSLGAEEPTLDMRARLKFLARYARRLVALMPILGDIKVLRQWAGPYDASPDGNPILGAPLARPGFYLACGFVGHGFMMAPVIGELYSDLLLGGAPHPIFAKYRLERFAGAADLEVEDFNIG